MVAISLSGPMKHFFFSFWLARFKVLFCLFFCGYACLLSAEEFVASVDQKELSLDETLTLTLSLKGSSAKSAPDFSPLQDSFLIHSQRQTFQTTIINGKITPSTNWKLILAGKQEGVATIPAITVLTAEGSLSTKPITVRFVKAASRQNGRDLIITSSVSDTQIYPNATFVYTVQLSSRRDLRNVSAEPLKVADAIVELQDKPTIYEKEVDGMLTGVIEYRYFITPTKAGELTIPPVVIRGNMIEEGQSRSHFDDDFDPFSLMRGLRLSAPFAVRTEEITLPVSLPETQAEAWLPAASLKIQEIWDAHQKIEQGEPFSLGFLIEAEGLHSSLLPSLQEKLAQKGLKIYADKPQLSDTLQPNSLHSRRKELYTIIPEEAGKIVIPKIEFPWWNTKKHREETIVIAEKILQVLPSKAGSSAPSQQTALESTSKPKTPSAPQATIHANRYFSALLLLLTFLLFACFLWALSLQRRLNAAIGEKRQNARKKKTHAAQKGVIQRSEKSEQLQELNPT